MRRIRIGTRRSMLAMAQAREVADALKLAMPQAQVELAGMVTAGDRRAGPLAPAGGKGLFTAELERALRSGEVDLAVHSAKDLPASMAADLTIAAVPRRQDARDALVCRGGPIGRLPAGASVGTSSPRRRAQLLAIRPDLTVLGLRGNVETRLNNALGGEADAVVLAMAGLNRSGLADKHAAQIHPFEIDEFIPAAGQGALAIQCRLEDAATAELLSALSDEASLQALAAERSVLLGLSAGCHCCLAVHVAPVGQEWQGLAMAARGDGSDAIRLSVRSASAAQAGAQLLEALLSAGAAERLAH